MLGPGAQLYRPNSADIITRADADPAVLVVLRASLSSSFFGAVRHLVLRIEIRRNHWLKKYEIPCLSRLICDASKYLRKVKYVLKGPGQKDRISG